MPRDYDYGELTLDNVDDFLSEYNYDVEVDGIDKGLKPKKDNKRGKDRKRNRGDAEEQDEDDKSTHDQTDLSGRTNKIGQAGKKEVEDEPATDGEAEAQNNQVVAK